MNRRSALPGGVVAPAVVIIASMVLTVIAVRDPEQIDLGPHFSPAGIGVLGSALSFFWLLVALGMKKKR